MLIFVPLSLLLLYYFIATHTHLHVTILHIHSFLYSQKISFISRPRRKRYKRSGWRLELSKGNNLLSVVVEVHVDTRFR